MNKMLSSKFNFVLMAIPVIVAMTACTGQVDLKDKADSLASRDTTHGAQVVLMPDSRPSVGDGEVYWHDDAFWQKNKAVNCASCHGADGKGVAGKCNLDLTNTEIMRARKPIEQYKAIAFGNGVITKMPVLSQEGTVENMEPVVVREFTHEAYSSKLDKRILWDLIFYARSLANPLLAEKEHAKIKIVFGSNCAVCHGTRGAGDGPLNKGMVLQPNPANFNQFNRFYDRTDEQLWDHIAHGIKWEGMPNFLGKKDEKNKVKFDADYIWKLVQYVRNFHEMPEFELESQRAKTLGLRKDEAAPAKDAPPAEEAAPAPAKEAAPAAQPADSKGDEKAKTEG